MSGGKEGAAVNKSKSKAGGRRQKGISDRVAAMSHPLRARCLHLLVVRGVMSPNELTLEIKGDRDMPDKEHNRLLGSVSYHCRRLCELDCAELVDTQPVRGAVEHFYRATERPLIDTDEWDQLDSITAEDLVCGYIQEILDDFVASRKAGVVGFTPEFHITRTPLVLDQEGFEEGMELFEKCRHGMSEIERKSAERRAKKGEAPVSVSSSLVYFKVPTHRFDA
jgi:hypothetical protein